MKFIDFLQSADTPLKMDDFLKLMETSPSTCIFIKSAQSTYQYANGNYIQLMGLRHLKDLVSLNDYDLSKDKKDAAKYRDHDNLVLEEFKAYHAEEDITPHFNQPIKKTMSGSLYPLCIKGERPNYILGVFTPQYNLLKLDFDTLFKLTHEEFNQLLTKRRYPIRVHANLVHLSKKEICVLIQLMRGAHAGEIAQRLRIKQTTVESYLVNIKNKLGVNSKSELLHLMISERFLEQIIL